MNITTENNKIIAEFMGGNIDEYSSNSWIENVKLPNNETRFHVEQGKYHSDWNWLMEVVGKIESLEDNNSLTNCFKQSNKVCELPIYTKIEMVYNACVEFIKWYNEQKEV